MMTILILFVLFCAWLVYIYFKIEKNKINLPGPKGLPLIGCLFQLDKKFHLSMAKWNEEYGKAYYFRIFNDHNVSIGDVKLGKELFSLDQLSGRPTFDFFLLYEGEKFGVINSQGDLWETHRRFTLRQLRDFGFGKNTMETLIMEEVHEFVDRLKAKKGIAVNGIKERFSLAVVNSLWTVVSGKRFSQDDPNLRAISNSLNEALTAPAESGGIIFLMPFLRYIMPDKLGYTATRNAFNQLEKFVAAAVKEHQATFQPDTCRDFIDVYLQEMQSVTDPKSTFYGKDGEKQCISVVADLFFAGTDTTSTTLAWAILYLATQPHVQKKLQKEISSITGDSRDVSVADRPSMPYMLATIDEVLRLSSILPNGVSHQVMTDVEWDGVLYKKGTMVSLNIFYIHHDPKYWGDPENFRPERFLSDDEKIYKKSDHIVTFSTGKRQCLGESLARDSLFLFIGNIFQNFTVERDPNNPNPTLEPGIGFSLNPQEYSVIFKTRNEE